MRFKSGLHNTSTFTKFTASLASLGPAAWVRLSSDEVRFTIIPEQGTQVWAVLAIDSIFENYTIQSAADNNTINLEVPLDPLLRALRSAAQATSVSIRLTKKDNQPVLTLTIVTNFFSSSGTTDPNTTSTNKNVPENEFDVGNDELDTLFAAGEPGSDAAYGPLRERETIITQDVPVRTLNASYVEGLHEPQCREPDVHIILPPLVQLKAISDRFTKLAVTTKSGLGGATSSSSGSAKNPKLEIWANMHGCLRLGLRNDSMNIASLWTGLTNPELDPDQVDGGEDGIRVHPSTKMRQLGRSNGEGDEGWAKVRIDGKDWSRVLSVGRLGGRVIACFCNEHALILYVYLPNEDDPGNESVLTYYISSYSI